MRTSLRLRPRLCSSLLLPVLALAGSTCTDPNVFLPSYQPGGPQGALDGTVTYSGPLPCTENQHVLGAAVFLAFDTRLLPPPEGLGTTAASLGALGGDQLFAGVVDLLTFNKDGSRWCPSTATSITVSGQWTVGPIPGGEYEIRSFYDLQGQFDPAFSISKLPHQGDVAGGAIDNVSDVLKGAAPIYRRITLGAQPKDGACLDDAKCVDTFGAGNTCQGGFCIPPEGANIGGIAVTLGLVLPLGLPIFYPAEVLGSTHACKAGAVTGAPAPPKDPTTLTLPSDYRLPVFAPSDPAGTEDSILRVRLAAGVKPEEVMAASNSPFNLPVMNPSFAFSWQDVNGDGKLDIDHDHVAASTLVPQLFPLAIFSKLAHPDVDHLTAQSSPAVILQGLTIYKSLISTVGLGLPPGEFDIPSDTDVFVGINPAVICLDPTDYSKDARAKLVLTHRKDCGDKDTILADESATTNALSKQFGRPVDLVEACLPQGKYAMNLVYSTGQAWTVPNEAGVCAASELPMSSDGTVCTGAMTPKGATPRPRLVSQDVMLTIGQSQETGYCVDHATPPECCPALKDPMAARVDKTTGQCFCPDTKNTSCL